MKYLWYLILVIFLLICPVIAVDTSNWVNITSNINVSFEMPPNWAWDPIDQTSVGIRSEKSDAFLKISYIPLIPPITEVNDSDFVNRVKKELGELHVPKIDEVTHDIKSVTISGMTLDGTIINYTEKFENNHSCHWVSEYSDNDSIIKYSDIIHTIIGSTRFY